VGGFYIDPAGMDGLYNLLTRASGDAADTLAYTGKHCDIDFLEEGYIFMLAGPHARAYESVTQALQRLQDLARSAGTQLNRAQLNYAQSDSTASARLDRAYPGAHDPAGLRGVLAHGRPDLQPARSAFTDVVEPAALLVAPNYATGIETYQLNALSDLVSPSAWLRQVCVWLFNYDPFEGWVKSISGDWEAYEHSAASWPIVGNAATAIGRNLITGAGDVATVWRGNAAEAEQEFQLALGTAAMALEAVCDRYGRLYREAAEAAKLLFSSVGGLVGQLLDALIIINAAAAIGTATIETVVGPIAGYGVAAYYIWQAYDLYKRISTVYQTAEVTIKGIAGAIAAVEAGQEIATLPILEPYRHPAVM
jgi:hypothetical protein